jgi:hypothetical protein
MTPSPRMSGIVIRWMSFPQHADPILKIRRRVFLEEQGFGADVLESPHDPRGLHLGAFHRGELISAIAVYIYDHERELLAGLGLPPATGRVVQYSKRVELSEYRQHRLGELLAAAMVCAVYETLRPRYTFFMLRGMHTRLKTHYVETLGFEHYATAAGADGDHVIMIMPESGLRAQYLKVHQLAEAAAARLGVRPPRLTRFLQEARRADLLGPKRASDKAGAAPLSLEDDGS